MQLVHENNKFVAKKFPITLICDRIYFQENLGSLFRIADSFGVEKIVFFGKDLPFNLKKINKTSRSTHKYIEYCIFEENETFLNYLFTNNFEIIALEITENSTPIKNVKVPSNKPIGLIIGNEIDGVSDYLLEKANQIAHITMFGKNSSMNVVQAASIALYEITMQLSSK